MSMLLLPGLVIAPRSQAASQSAQYGASSLPQSAEDIRLLEQEKPVERELTPGETHRYQLSLGIGQYLRVVFDAKGAGANVTLIGPDGEDMDRSDSSNSQQVAVFAVAGSSGNHSLEVRSLADKGPSHSYRISIAELRDAKPEDHRRIIASQVVREGTRLQLEGSPQSLRQSIEKFHEAMPIIKEMGDRQSEANNLATLGYVHHLLAEYKNSLDYYEQSLPLYVELGDRSNQANTLSQIGNAYKFLGQYRKVIESYTKALPLIRAEGNRPLEAIALESIANAHYVLGEFQEALEYNNQALSLYREENNRLGEANALSGLGNIYSTREDSQRALEHYEQAKELYRALGNQKEEINVLVRIGQTHALLGERREALEIYNRALPLLRSVGDPFGEAAALIYIGEIHYLQNEYQKALDLYNQALAIYRQADYKSGEAVTLNSLGQVYAMLGDQERALDLYNQSLTIYRANDNRLGQAVLLNNIGHSQLSSNDDRKALDSLNQALSLLRQVGNRRREASMHNNIGAVRTSLGEYQKALESYSQALRLNREIGNRRGEASVLNNEGRTYLAMRDYDKAFDRLNGSRELSRAVSDRKREAQALYHMARMHRARGNLIEARSHSEAAIALTESLRYEVNEHQLRASHFASLQQFYDLNIDVLMQMHKEKSSEGFHAAALEMSERRRARSLLDLLAESSADIRQGVDPSLLARERSLGELLDAKAARQTRVISGKHTPEQAAAAAEEIESLITDYRQTKAQIRATSPRYAALTQPQPTSLRDIQQQVLDRDTLLLEYALGDERSYLWAVSSGSIASYELPKREDIEAAARSFYELLRGGESGRGEAKGGGDTETEKGQKAKGKRQNPESMGRGELEEAALRLSRMLLAPVADRLGAKRLVIVADGVLHYIPFAALPAPGREGKSKKAKGKSADDAPFLPLILKNEIVTLASASVLAEMRRELAGRALAAKEIAVFAGPVFTLDDPRLKSSGKGEITQADEEVLGNWN